MNITFFPSTFKKHCARISQRRLSNQAKAHVMESEEQRSAQEGAMAESNEHAYPVGFA